MSGIVYHGWQKTPLWLRLLGFQRWRRWTELNYYHCFSEWEYTDALPAKDPSHD